MLFGSSPVVPTPMTPPVATEPAELRRRTLRQRPSTEEPLIEQDEPLIPYQVDSLDHGEKETKVLAKEALAIGTQPPRQPINWTFVALLTIAAYASRFYKISAGAFVLWDEAHFGKFSSYYLRRMFYFDVHPPLAKMLVALGGYLAGVDGSFEFPSGTPYPEGFNYVFMRMFVAAFGTLIVPFTYLTAVQLRLGKYAAYLCATMALFGIKYYRIPRLKYCREWIHWDHSIDPPGLYADLLHQRFCTRLRLFPQPGKEAIRPQVVDCPNLHWCCNWVRLQCQMGRFPCHRLGRFDDHRGALDDAW